MHLKTVLRLIITGLTLIILTNTAAATEVAIKEVLVKYDKSGVDIEFYYELDSVQKLKGILFGAAYIEEDLMSLFNDTENPIVKKVDFESAKITVPVKQYNGFAYFPGIKFCKHVSNLTLIFPGNSLIKLENTCEIPEAFYSI
jgi:hypothetical protein